jgi:lactobin A/cerein 7B family class IIb bacteriocin
MTRSLETLNTLGTELSGTQLETVDGGAIPLLIIAALAGFDAGLWGYIRTH